MLKRIIIVLILIALLVGCTRSRVGIVKEKYILEGEYYVRLGGSTYKVASHVYNYVQVGQRCTLTSDNDGKLYNGAECVQPGQ